jgi:hypothetical protein
MKFDIEDLRIYIEPLQILLKSGTLLEELSTFYLLPATLHSRCLRVGLVSGW